MSTTFRTSRRSSDIASSARVRPVGSSRRQRQVRHIVLHLLLAGGSLFMLLPFAWALSTSLKAPAEVFTMPVRWLPEQPRWENYVELFRIMPFDRFYINSLFVAISATALEVFTATLAAFAFARLRFRGREALFVLYLATLMVPNQVTLIPTFAIIRQIGWYDTYQALIIPPAFNALGVFLLRQYFRSIPIDLDEAARLDGASSFQIWWRIILPLSLPGISALTIFSFLLHWNAFLWPLVVTFSPEMATLPVGLRSLQGQFAVQWHLLMAGTIVAIIPLLILFVFAQRWIMESMAWSGSGKSS